MSKNNDKTNVMRILDQKKIPYISHNYLNTGAVSGTEVAEALGEELNLKKAAQSVGEKSIEMIRSKELLPLTGYIHGGCSPIGMKKQFRTVIDKSAQTQERIIFSGGKIGYQVEMTLKDLEKVIRFQVEDVAE